MTRLEQGHDRRPSAAVLAALAGVLRLAHPAAGELRLPYGTLELPADDDQRLVVYLPADEATSVVLDRLLLRGLHAVAS